MWKIYDSNKTKMCYLKILMSFYEELKCVYTEKAYKLVQTADLVRSAVFRWVPLGQVKKIANYAARNMYVVEKIMHICVHSK